jgi:hypothetical protein
MAAEHERFVRMYRGAGRHRVRSKPSLAVALTVVVVAALVTIAVTSSAVRHQLRVSFTRIPAKYSELFFVDSPSTGFDQRATVRFTICNHEGSDIDYRYTIAVLDGSMAPISRNDRSVAVRNEGSATESIAVALPEDSQWRGLEIDLTGRTERIRYIRPMAESEDSE